MIVKSTDVKTNNKLERDERIRFLRNIDRNEGNKKTVNSDNKR